MKRRRNPTRATATVVTETDPVEVLISSARRVRRRGDERRARQLLRDACALDEWRPRTFALLGAWLLASNLHEEARQKLRHARWLTLRAGEARRVRTFDGVLARAGERAA